MVNLAAMPACRGKMEKYQNRHIRQAEHATKQWEASAHKVTNINNRRKVLDRQNNTNYGNEYDGIRGELPHHMIPHESTVRLKKRLEELKNMFSSGNV